MVARPRAAASSALRHAARSQAAEPERVRDAMACAGTCLSIIAGVAERETRRGLDPRFCVGSTPTAGITTKFVDGYFRGHEISGQQFSWSVVDSCGQLVDKLTTRGIVLTGY